MIFPYVYLNFTDQKIISSSFYYPTRLVPSDSRFEIYIARLDTRLELKCNSFCTPARVAINNHLKNFRLFETIYDKSR